MNDIPLSAWTTAQLESELLNLDEAQAPALVRLSDQIRTELYARRYRASRTIVTNEPEEN